MSLNNLRNRHSLRSLKRNIRVTASSIWKPGNMNSIQIFVYLLFYKSWPIARLKKCSKITNVNNTNKKTHGVIIDKVIIERQWCTATHENHKIKDCGPGTSTFRNSEGYTSNLIPNPPEHRNKKSKIAQIKAIIKQLSKNRQQLL